MYVFMLYALIAQTYFYCNEDKKRMSSRSGSMRKRDRIRELFHSNPEPAESHGTPPGTPSTKASHNLDPSGASPHDLHLAEDEFGNPLINQMKMGLEASVRTMHGFVHN